MGLILIRHPAPQVAPGLCYGSSDLPPDPAALAACHASIGAALPPDLLRAAPIWTSPLRRCTELAALLAATPGRPAAAIPDARLAELHFGAWELRAWDDIPRAEVDAWAADLLHYRPGGGESVLDAARRVQFFLRELTGPAIVVCHAGTIRLMQALHNGAPLHAAALKAAAAPHAIPYGSVIEL
ncbi:histidine phosphatase family protein [Pseudoduganella sp. RAF53_2]|uniref:histidine phosphatase family protein n=1 Tax=unclassified Pseudoduganella TaxID=2637179 RepID=UPI003F94E5C5